MNEECPNKQEWLEFLLGNKTEQELHLAQHLANCQSCQLIVDRLESAFDGFETLLQHDIKTGDFATEPECGAATEFLIRQFKSPQ